MKSIALFSYLSPKLKLLYQGRRDFRFSYLAQADSLKKKIWFHCASYGEFEGILALIQEYKQRGDYHIICSFFSPSGFEPLHTHRLIDHCIYLPFDTKAKMIQLIKKLKPDCLIVSQNEYWPNMINQSLAAGLPVYYVGTYVRERHWWLQSFLRFLTDPLHKVNMIFLQDSYSERLMKEAGFTNIKLAGNPRIDQVIDNKNEIRKFPLLNKFCENNVTIVCGSTLHSDENILFQASALLDNFKFIIVPHDPEDFVIPHAKFNADICFHSAFQDSDREKKILIYDSIGDLKYLYKFATIAFVGGGFDKGVHNTLEPAVFNLPIISGPEIKKFNHAINMYKLDVLSTVNSVEELVSTIIKNKNGLDQETKKRLSAFLRKHAGATKQIVSSIQF